MERLLLLVTTHFIGDFAFQSEWMAKCKGTSREVLFYHVATYVSAMYAFMLASGYHPTPQGILVDGAVHFLADGLKGRGIVKSIWLDQCIHLATRLALWQVGWL